MQIKILTSSVLLLILSSLHVSGNDFVEEIRNGYFQNGQIKPACWTYRVRKPSKVEWIFAGAKHRKCLLLNCVHSGVSVSQKVTLIPGKEYYLSFQYKFSDISPYVNLYVKFSPTDKVSWRLYPKNIYWTHFVRAFKAKSEKAEILITVGKKGQKVWLDNFRLTDCPPIIINGGFENISRAKSPYNWKFRSVSGVPRFFLSREAYRGTFAAGIKNKGTAYLDTVVRDIVPGYDYEIKGFYFSNNKCFPEISLKFMDVDNKQLSQVAPAKFILRSQGKWNSFKKIVHIPGEVAGIRLSLGGTSVLNGQILWDNVSFKQIKSGE